MGMAAGYDEAQKRRFQFWIGDVICRDMGSQMVYRDEGKSRRKGEPFGKVHAYQQGADQARRIGNGDSVYPGEGNLRLIECLRVTPTIASEWRRDAISGTTPP